MPERRPLRHVRASHLKEGRGSVLGPDTDRRARWWELRLECGHTVERAARYWPLGAGHQRQRSRFDVLAAPKRTRCGSCPPLEST